MSTIVQQFHEIPIGTSFTFLTMIGGENRNGLWVKTGDSEARLTHLKRKVTTFPTDWWDKKAGATTSRVVVAEYIPRRYAIARLIARGFIDPGFPPPDEELPGPPVVDQACVGGCDEEAFLWEAPVPMGDAEVGDG